MALVTLAQVKTDLAIDSGDTSCDTPLSDAIAEAGARVVSFIGQPIEATVVTEVFDGNGWDSATLGYHPMSALTILETRGGIGSGWTEVDAETYELTANTIYYAGGFDEGVANYRATFTVGYDSSSIPADVVGVAREMVIVRAKSTDLAGIGEHRLGVASVGENRAGVGVTTSYLDLTPSWKERLAPYRRTHGG